MSNQTIEENNKFKFFISKAKENLKMIWITAITITVCLLLIVFFYKRNDHQNNLLSEKFNNAKILVQNEKNEDALIILNEIIEKKNKFYSPISLYFAIENNLINDPETVVKLFDKVISNRKIDKENKNLIKIKKAIFLINHNEEQKVLEILNPIINSQSIWRNDAAKLLGDYFNYKGEDIKASEYYKLLNTKSTK
tara:strand:- start:994 stop:1578 length:585 start_codon:yes stop_codon:yes gene_type:complete